MKIGGKEVMRCFEGDLLQVDMEGNGVRNNF
jgi:hypothetical protein